MPERRSSGRRSRRHQAVELKIFGFFDILQVEEVEANSHPKKPAPLLKQGPEAISRDRQQRVLFGYGDRRAVRALLKQGANETEPSFLAVCLLKLAGNTAHGGYARWVRKQVERSGPNGVYLGCLDAPDVIVLKTFGGPDDDASNPLDRLLDWTARLPSTAPFNRGRLERSLTMVACRKKTAVIRRLAKSQEKGTTQALMRLTDLQHGTALRKLYRKLDDDGRLPAFSHRFKVTVGYYDAQAALSLPETALVIELSRDMVQDGLLTTSTCFMGPPPRLKRPPSAPAKAIGWQLIDDLLPAWKRLEAALRKRQRFRGLDQNTRTAAADAVSKFKRLHHTGLIPGSRLLLWTCRDALNSFAKECQDHAWLRLQSGSVGEHDSDFYNRQVDYGKLFRAISNELDRRVSLSLPAHTRFFPCSLDVSLKIVGALDVASRLVAAGARCFHCRRQTGLLQVFTASADKPSSYFSTEATYVPRRDRPPYPTLMVTSFSPRMVRHFYLALFTVMHEVGQCILKDTIKGPCFSAVVFTQAYVERFAAISTLACLRQNAPPQTEVPAFVETRCTDFLTREVANPEWWEQEFPVGPYYFAQPNAIVQEELFPEDEAWEKKRMWKAQGDRWMLSHVNIDSTEGYIECFQLYRDSCLLHDLERAWASATFPTLWATFLYSSFGQLTSAGLQKSKPGEPANARDEIARLNSALKRWSFAARLDEYLEIASFVPFLRLFERDATGTPLLDVMGHLIRDYANVWLDSDDPTGAYNSARRFLVAYAAMDLLRTQRRSRTDAEPCTGPIADDAIHAALVRSSRSLLANITSSTPPMPDSRARAACIDVWQYVLDGTGKLRPATFAFEAECGHPLLLIGMVRFLVRMMHVHSLDGGNVIPDKKTPLETLYHQLRQIFSSRSEKRNQLMPVEHITELWSLQYRLSEGAHNDYRFELAEAIKAAGWKNPSL